MNEGAKYVILESKTSGEVDEKVVKGMKVFEGVKELGQ